MSLPSIEIAEPQLVGYLLGTLPEAETEQFDESSIGDDVFASRLRVVEQDLIDAYVRNTLPPGTRSRFELCYLSSPRGRGQVRIADAFLGAIDRAARRADAAAPQRCRFSRAQLLIATAASVLLAAGVSLVTKQSTISHNSNVQQTVTADRTLAADGAQPAERSQAAVQAPPRPQTSRRPAAPETALAIALVLPPPTRSADMLPLLVEPARDNPVRLRVEMAANDAERYRATLRDPAGSRVLWRSAWLKPVAPAGSVPSIVVELPPRLLNSQRYWLELQGSRMRSDTDVIATYAFQVVSR